ncbi:MAG: hypothetical protein K5754_07780 [Butyrivibrio sp.]|nr:hypothetical protein [Butyrivibrio sp.]
MNIKKIVILIMTVVVFLFLLIIGIFEINKHMNPVAYGEYLAYIASDGNVYMRSGKKEQNLGMELDDSNKYSIGFYTDTCIRAMTYVNSNRINIYPVHLDGDPIIMADNVEYEAGESYQLDGHIVTFTMRGLFYEDKSGDLMFTDFYTKTLVSDKYRKKLPDGNIFIDSSIHAVISDGGMNLFVLLDGVLYEYRPVYENGIVRSFESNIVDTEVIGIIGDRQEWNELFDEYDITSETQSITNLEEFTNLYYWKKDEDNASNDEYGQVCKVIYYDAFKKSSEVVADRVIASAQAHVYENGKSYYTPYITDGENGYLLFSGKKIPIEYPYEEDWDYSGYGFPGLGYIFLSSSELYFDYSNYNMYLFRKDQYGNFVDLTSYDVDASGNINPSTQKILNNSFNGGGYSSRHVYTITDKGIIYSTDYEVDFSTGTRTGLLYCDDHMIIDGDTEYKVITDLNNTFIGINNDAIYKIVDGQLEMVQKADELIHVDCRNPDTFDFFVDGILYRSMGGKAIKLTKNKIKADSKVYYFYGTY